MEKQLTITAEGAEHKAKQGATFADVAKAARKPGQRPALGAIMGNRLYELNEALPGSGALELVDLTHEEGARIYARSACFLLVRAMRELHPGARVMICRSINQSLYCEMRWERRVTPADLKAIETRMREIVGRDEPFERVVMQADEARALFEADGRPETAALVKPGEPFTVHRCGAFTDAWYGPLAPSTGCVSLFRLHHYLPGFLLMIPNKYSPDATPPYREAPKMSAVFNESAEFERLIGVRNISDLNGAIRAGEGRDIVRMCERWHERCIERIADAIMRERRRVVLIAGPSSSGKTTFAHRLTVHLMACGIRPLALSLDDYYLDRNICPKDAEGKYDLESVNALDLPLFEDQVSSLLAGEAVALARFDFKTGTSGRADRETMIHPGQPLIIEGINGLNDKLTHFMPAGTKYRIFASALTQLNIDDHNRVSTTDLRLLRRLMRDQLFRGHSAAATIADWADVNAGAFKNIFPHQENADAIFNSSLVYELAAFHDAALKLLDAIPADDPARIEADRLSTLLRLVEPLPCMDEIPPTSIIREFIGGCTFYS